jgi:hypothetical protein
MKINTALRIRERINLTKKVDEKMRIRKKINHYKNNKKLEISTYQ